MNRTIKEATVKRFHYDGHDQLRAHLDSFVAAYNFARRLKTLKAPTPYEFICKLWTAEPERFRIDPIRQMPGLNTWPFKTRLTEVIGADNYGRRHKTSRGPAPRVFVCRIWSSEPERFRLYRLRLLPGLCTSKMPLITLRSSNQSLPAGSRAEDARQAKQPRRHRSSALIKRDHGIRNIDSGKCLQGFPT